MAIPEPAPSLPDQLRVKLVEVSVAGNALTLLVGVVLSIVMGASFVGLIPSAGSVSLIWSVVIGAFESKVIVATLRIWVPVASPALGAIV